MEVRWSGVLRVTHDMFVSIWLFVAGILSGSVCRWWPLMGYKRDESSIVSLLLKTLNHHPAFWCWSLLKSDPAARCFHGSVKESFIIKCCSCSVMCTYPRVASCGNNTYSFNNRNCPNFILLFLVHICCPPGKQGPETWPWAWHGID